MEIYNTLINEAIRVREKAYVPYSNFKVGASVLMDESLIFSGCNIENVSFGATNCAERTAIFKGVSEGAKEIEALCVVGSLKELTYPCGICRQVIIEFAKNLEIPIIVANNIEKYEVYKLKDIATFCFNKNHLNI